MGQLENKFAQAATGTKNEEKEELAVEKKSAENVEANISHEQVEAFAKESEDDITKVGENAASEGKHEFENAVQAGTKLELKKEEIDQIASEMNVGENLQTKQEEIDALTRETKEKISKVAEMQPESAQEVRVSENIEVGAESTQEKTQESPEVHPKYSEEEARKNWKTLSMEEKMAYCSPEIVAQEMSADLNLKNNPEAKQFKGESFSENSEIINDNVRNLVEAYIGEAKISPEYGEKIRKSTEDYVNLISQAQKEGSLAENLKASDIQKISEDIVNKMVYQNRESFKRGLGDHGVRHIIDGNIAEAMKMVDEFNKANPEKQLNSLDRLKIMTIHFNHDMGYTVGVNRKGFESTGDHKYFSQKLFESQEEMYGKLFGKKDLEQIGETIKTHDEAQTDFEKQPFESIVRLSDNMGLFHDSKLPEIFYSVPENMAVLQKIDLARKAGQSIDGLKNELKNNVMKQEGLDEDTRKALLNAAEEINKMAPDFNLGMLAGKLDGYEMQGSKMVVNIRESDMHKQIQELFELNQKQFVKALDSYGIKLDKMGTSFDQYVKTDENGTKYVELPVSEGKPALRFNFLPENLNEQDNRNAEVKKKFAETATEWAGMNIRAEVNSAMKELKELKETRTSENIDNISFELQAQLDDSKLSTKDREQISGLMDGLKNSLNNEEEFIKKIDQFGKFLTEREKEFLAVN
jgi:hypothetical protein